MIPLIHPWTDWQVDELESNEFYSWKWKESTPEEIKNQYKEWIEYYNKSMKYGR